MAQSERTSSKELELSAEQSFYKKKLRKREGTGIIIRVIILQKNLRKRGNFSTITVNIRMMSHLLIMGLYLNLGLHQKVDLSKSI